LLDCSTDPTLAGTVDSVVPSMLQESPVMERLKVSVRSLVEHSLRSGDLSLETLDPVHAIEGLRIHQKIQASRPEGYQTEVTISHTVTRGDTTLEVLGRIDGLYPDSDPVALEEIKTTSQDLDLVRSQEKATHWGQAKTYAFMYADSNGLDSVDVQLTYCHATSGKILEQRESFTLSELRNFFIQIVDHYLGWMNLVSDWILTRNESIRDLQFPFSEYRPGQREMAVAIYRTIQDEGQLLVQAPTGIGKTVATLVPAFKGLAEEKSEKLFYLTARTTGKGIAEDTLGHLYSSGLRAKCLTLTAKDKICFNPEKACNGEECSFAKGFYDRLNDALLELFEHDVFNRQKIEEVSRRHHICPFEFSLELSLWSDCIVCDYNYAFDPRVALRRLLTDDKATYTFIVDEAHNLPDRARDMFSAVLSKKQCLEVRRGIKKAAPDVHKAMGSINAWMLNALKKRVDGDEELFSEDPPKPLYRHLRKFTTAAEAWLAQPQSRSSKHKEPVLEYYFEVRRFLRVAERFNQCYVTCYKPAQQELQVKLFCMDPAPQLAEGFLKARSSILFSATLTPISYFGTVLGCRAESDSMVLPSPFPPENNCVLVDDRTSTLYRHRAFTKRDVAKKLQTFVGGRQGNYLLFFPSYAYLSMVLNCLPDNVPFETVVQYSTMTEQDRDEFLALFKADCTGTLVGFSVLGGFFGEGIDLVGERLTGVAIVGVGLPSITPERELLRDYYTMHTDYGYDYSYRYPGMQRVLQAAGRLIRSETDRGAILLIDHRYRNSSYSSLLPGEWRPSRATSERQLSKTLEEFWARDNNQP
jgi:DNA excision repair protein ERCC-2